MSTLATPAWSMAGRLRNIPGILAAGRGRLAFVTHDGPLFDVPLTEVADVRWPWHWFGGGCRFTVSGHEYAMTFVRPNGAPAVTPSMLDLGASVATVLSLGAVHPSGLTAAFDVRDGRRAGAAWKAALPVA